MYGPTPRYQLLSFSIECKMGTNEFIINFDELKALYQLRYLLQHTTKSVLHDVWKSNVLSHVNFSTSYGIIKTSRHNRTEESEPENRNRYSIGFLFC